MGEASTSPFRSMYRHAGCSQTIPPSFPRRRESHTIPASYPVIPASHPSFPHRTHVIPASHPRHSRIAPVIPASHPRHSRIALRHSRVGGNLTPFPPPTPVIPRLPSRHSRIIPPSFPHRTHVIPASHSVIPGLPSRHSRVGGNLVLCVRCDSQEPPTAANPTELANSLPSAPDPSDRPTAGSTLRKQDPSCRRTRSA